MPPPPPTRYLLSRVGDPLFALFIGTGAALARISREERAVGRNWAQTVELAKTRWRLTAGN